MNKPTIIDQSNQIHKLTESKKKKKTKEITYANEQRKEPLHHYIISNVELSSLCLYISKKITQNSTRRKRIFQTFLKHNFVITEKKTKTCSSQQAQFSTTSQSRLSTLLLPSLLCTSPMSSCSPSSAFGSRDHASLAVSIPF